jgi:glycosyltransferase involved in cell wall biosynthesis
LFKTFIPSKMFEIMACGVPIVASVEGESADILNESQAAEVVKPDDPEQIIQAILKLKNDKVLLEKIQKNGPAFVEQNYSRRKLAEQYLKIISEA